MMERARFGTRLTPTVLQLILTNVVIWIGCGLLGAQSDSVGWIYRHLALRPTWTLPDSLFHGEIWQIFTYMWLHDLGSIFHLLFNMLMIYFLGGLFEQRWGRRAFISFYVLCGVGAAVITAIVGAALPGVFGNPVIGASGAIIGFVAAFARTFPDQRIYIWFVLPVQGRHILWIVVAVDLLIFVFGDSNIAFATHMGGLITGYLLVTGFWRPGRLAAMIRRKSQPPKRHLRVVRERDDPRGPWLH
jgi:membrane associated rhomboid family serine protease